MNYKNTETEESEVLTAEDQMIRASLNNLNRVGAPPDFDFRLNARIARAKSDNARAPRFFLPALRSALPLGLVILTGAFAVFNGVYFDDMQSVPPVAENQIQIAAPEERISNELIKEIDAPKEAAGVSNSSAAKTTGSQTAVNTPPAAAAVDEFAAKRRAKILPRANAREPENNSRTSALTAAKTMTPPGINPNKTIDSSPNADGAKTLTAREILAQLGIEAIFRDENWRVKSVAQNSLAARSGVRAGDAVEAIDGEKLTDKPFKRQTIEGKRLTVARGAEKIEISLANQSN